MRSIHQEIPNAFFITFSDLQKFWVKSFPPHKSSTWRVCIRQHFYYFSNKKSQRGCFVATLAGWTGGNFSLSAVRSREKRRGGRSFACALSAKTNSGFPSGAQQQYFAGRNAKVGCRRRAARRWTRDAPALISTQKNFPRTWCPLIEKWYEFTRQKMFFFRMCKTPGFYQIKVKKFSGGRKQTWSRIHCVSLMSRVCGCSTRINSKKFFPAVQISTRSRLAGAASTEGRFAINSSSGGLKSAL